MMMLTLTKLQVFKHVIRVEFQDIASFALGFKLFRNALCTESILSDIKLYPIFVFLFKCETKN